MVTMGVFPLQGKTHMVEPGIEPRTSWLVVRNSDHQATRLVWAQKLTSNILAFKIIITTLETIILATGSDVAENVG